MHYPNVTSAVFLSRPNRFVAQVLLEGEVITVHVKNTGRCRELLLPGAQVWLTKSTNPNRKTAYDLIAVQKGARLINMDAQAPNQVVYEWAAAGHFVPQLTLLKPECRHGDSRFDFYWEAGPRKGFVEVKGVTLERDGAAYFGVRRFDREDGGKVHVHTACGLLHASHRYASLDYENLFRLGKSLTRNLEDVEKLVRLMAFNVRLGNQDDHSKNFSFLLDAKGRWRLAPAYDLTPSRGVGGEQTCMVYGKRRDIRDKDMIAAASVVDVPARTVKAILEQVGEAVAALPAILAEVSG